VFFLVNIVKFNSDMNAVFMETSLHMVWI